MPILIENFGEPEFTIDSKYKHRSVEIAVSPANQTYIFQTQSCHVMNCGSINMNPLWLIGILI